MVKKTESTGKERPRIKPPEIRPRETIVPRSGTMAGQRAALAGARPSRPLRTFPPHAPRESERVSKEDMLRFIPLGGLEEIGRNCYFFEYKDEIILVDVGIQFPEEETPGIDYIIPNIAYLESRRDRIQAILITHGHYDHMAAIHYLIEKLGNPVIYTADFTKAMIEKRHMEFPNAPKLKFKVVKHGDHEKLGRYFDAEFFNVDHTIPDALGFFLKTPIGNLVSFGDFRLKMDKDGKPAETEIFGEIGKRGVHSVFIDSTNAYKPGFSFSEEQVNDNLYELMSHAKGRIILATFSSLLTRLFEVVKLAEKLGRKVMLNGRSMKDNFQIAEQLGYLKAKKDLIVPLEDIGKYDDNKIVILTTGSQGEKNAGLMRIVNGEHRIVHLKTTDTVIFSSSVVPGNERSVQALQDNIARQVDELYNVKILDIHASGHAHQEDLKFVLKLIKPKFTVPIHGYYFFRTALRKVAEAVGLPRESVMVMDNGQIAELTPNSFTITKQTVPASYVMVDGLGVGDVEEVVLRDRRALSAEGMIVTILTVDRDKGRLLKNPDIISRGFIYLKNSQELLDEIRKRIRGLMQRLPAYREVEPDYLKTLIRDQIGQYVYTKTKRRPMILPVIIEV